VTTDSFYLRQLTAAVARLAAPAAVQSEYLLGSGTYPSADELALEFHDLAMAEGQLREATCGDPQALQLIRSLDKKLEDFSGADHVDDWDVAALATSPNWAEVRQIAQRLLATLR
jgi:hypothetical protein